MRWSGPRALDDVLRIVGEFAGDHPVGGDAEVDRRQPPLLGLVDHRLAPRRWSRAYSSVPGWRVDRAGDAARNASGEAWLRASRRIGSVARIDAHRIGGRPGERGRRRLGERASSRGERESEYGRSQNLYHRTSRKRAPRATYLPSGSETRGNRPDQSSCGGKLARRAKRGASPPPVTTVLPTLTQTCAASPSSATCATP